MSKEQCPDSADRSGRDESDEGADKVHDGLTAKQSEALEALLQGQTINSAAATAHISERTLRRWIRKEPFRTALLDGRREAFQQAIGLTARYAPVAVGTLVKVMNDQLASPSARVTAAAVLLKFGREGIELDDLAARVEALERAAAGLMTPSNPKPQLRLTSPDAEEA